MKIKTNSMLVNVLKLKRLKAYTIKAIIYKYCLFSNLLQYFQVFERVWFSWAAERFVTDASKEKSLIYSQHFLESRLGHQGRWVLNYLPSLPFSEWIEDLSSGHGDPAITASISHVSRGTFVMFLQPLEVTC